MPESFKILTTGAQLKEDQGAWSVYYNNSLIEVFDNKAQALCCGLNKEYLENAFKQRYQKTA